MHSHLNSIYFLHRSLQEVMQKIVCEGECGVALKVGEASVPSL